MNDTDRPTRDPSIETVVLGTEAVLFDERNGMVHHLNPSACSVWTLLDGRAVDNLIAELSEATGVPAGALRPEVLQAIGEFERAGLLAG